MSSDSTRHFLSLEWPLSPWLSQCSVPLSEPLPQPLGISVATRDKSSKLGLSALPSHHTQRACSPSFSQDHTLDLTSTKQHDDPCPLPSAILMAFQHPPHLTSPGVSISRNHGALRKTKINIKTILLNYGLYLDSTSFSINILFLFWTQFTIAPFSQCSCLLVSSQRWQLLGLSSLPIGQATSEDYWPGIL